MCWLFELFKIRNTINYNDCNNVNCNWLGYGASAAVAGYQNGGTKPSKPGRITTYMFFLSARSLFHSAEV